MKKRILSLIVSAALVLGLVPATALAAPPDSSADTVCALKVNAREDPLGIDDLNEFSWNMVSSRIGAKQSSYCIVLAGDANFETVVWDSGVVSSDASVGIPYDGPALTPETDYYWKVRVTDDTGCTFESEPAHFSTGLMNDLDRSVWNGAQFIGSTDIAFRSPYMHVGHVDTEFAITKGDNFSFVFGADDFRFSEPAMNPFNTPGGENFLRIEINTSDITADSNPGAQFALYRVGYDETDTMNGDPNVFPYKWGRLDPSVITFENKNDTHNLCINLNNGSLTIQVDGTDLPVAAYADQLASTRAEIGTPIADGAVRPIGLEDEEILRRPGAMGWIGRPGAEGSVQAFNNDLTPNLAYPEDPTAAISANTGGNHNPYPNLNSIGFQVNNAGDEIVVTNLQINERNNEESRIVFSSDTGATYEIFSDTDGITVDGPTITVTGTEETAGDPIYKDPSSGSMKYLRTEFTADKEIADAKLYATAFGGYEMYINGARVGDDWFTPGLTQYREYLNYNTYDVTDMLRNGDNALGAVVGVGFYAGYMANTNYNTWTDDLGAMAKLVITYADGTKDVIVTDPQSWQVCSEGPVVFTDIYDGYCYDANNEANIAGWDQPGFEDVQGTWSAAEVISSKHAGTSYPFEKVRIIARDDEPVRVADTRKAVRVLDTHFDNDDGTTYTYDMGTAMAGVPSITIPAGSLKAGDRVVVRSAETIYPGNADSIDFDGNVITNHNTTGTPDYSYAELYGPEGAYRKNAAGKLLWDTNRAALASDIYIATAADASRDVVFQPSNTFHGYRYVTISIPNRTQPLPLDNVVALELSSIEQPVNYLTGTTSDTSAQYPDGRTAALHMQFFKNTLQSQFANFISIPTDCPQRNERQGWTGDLQLYSRTATYHSLQTQNFLRQWMDSVTADLGPNGGMGTTSPVYGFSEPSDGDTSIVWGGAIVQAPWQLFRQYGDSLVVRDNYEFIKRYIDNSSRGYTEADATYPLLTTISGLADHIGLEGNTSGGNGSCLLQNVLLMHLVRSTASMADAMGEPAYADSLRARYETMVDSWNRCFVDPATGMTLNKNVATGELTETEQNGVKNAYIDTQSTYAYALYYGIVSDTMQITEGENAGMTYRDFFAKRLSELVANPMLSGNGKGPLPNSSFVLVSGGPYKASGRPYTITTGFAATPSILPALTSTGNNEAAYRMFSNTDFATWLYPVTLGATTQWELWDGYDRALMWGGTSGMNSFNHFALGSSVEWVYEYMMGVTSGDTPGYKNFVLQPTPGGNYTSMEGGYESNYGMINVAWTAKGNGAVDDAGKTVQTNEMTSYSVNVPANTTATLYLPVQAAKVAIETPGVIYEGQQEHNGQNCAKFTLSSGGFKFAMDGGAVTVMAGDGYSDGIYAELTATKDGTTVAQLRDMLALPAGATVVVHDAQGNAIDAQGIVATGQTLDILDAQGNLLSARTIVVKGDVTGSGKMDAAQLTRLGSALGDPAILTDPQKLAGDLDGSGTLNIVDLVQESALLKAVQA